MILSELADLVCEKVGQTDTESLALCKQFLRQRYRMIWDSAAWRESLVTGTVTSTPGSALVLLPAWMERCLAVRAAGVTLLAMHEAGTLLQLNPQAWDQEGDAIGFTHAAPAVAFASPQLWVSYPDDLPAALGRKTTIVYEQANGNVSDRTITFQEASYQIAGAACWVLAWSAEATTPTSVVDGAIGWTLSTAAGGGDVATLPLFKTTAPRHARIRLTYTPKAATTLLVLGKRPASPLEDDSDAPELQGCENALIAFAHADMLEKQRQYAKGQLKLAEATAQMAILRDLEKNQSASVTRIVPVMEPDAFENASSGFSGKGFW